MGIKDIVTHIKTSKNKNSKATTQSNSSTSHNTSSEDFFEIKYKNGEVCEIITSDRELSNTEFEQKFLHFFTFDDIASETPYMIEDIITEKIPFGTKKTNLTKYLTTSSKPSTKRHPRHKHRTETKYVVIYKGIEYNLSEITEFRYYFDKNNISSSSEKCPTLRHIDTETIYELKTQAETIYSYHSQDKYESTPLRQLEHTILQQSSDGDSKMYQTIKKFINNAPKYQPIEMENN